MRGGVELSRSGHDREARDLYIWHSRSCLSPACGAGRQEENTEVARAIEIAGRIVADKAGDGNIAQIEAEIGPHRGACDGVVGNIEDMAGRCGRGGAEAAVGDPRMVGVRRIDVNAADEAIRTVGGERVDARESHRGCGFRIGTLADEHAAGGRRGPQRGRITASTLKRSHAIPTSTVRAEARTDQLPRRAGISERSPIAAGNRKDAGEFVAIRAEGRNALGAHALRLGAPQATAESPRLRKSKQIGTDGRSMIFQKAAAYEVNGEDTACAAICPARAGKTTLVSN